MLLSISLKGKLHRKSIEVKEESASLLVTAIEEAQQNANEYGQPKDRYDSFRAQLLRKRDMLAQQLAVIQDEIHVLHQIKPEHVSTKVEPGALVMLNSQTLYILVGIGKMILEGDTFYIVSPVVPIITAMKDMKKGDSFTFRGTTMTILDIC